MKYKIIALSGWKQSGKDTVANYLVENAGYIRLGFADILKDMVAEQYKIPRTWCDNPEYKELPLDKYRINPQDGFSQMIADFMQKEFKEFGGHKYWTPRALCILEGSIKQSVNSGYWVQKVVDYIKEFSEAHSNTPEICKFVISDLRYRSEVDQLREAFGDKLLTCRINRFEDSPSNDPSERDLDKHEFDSSINNIGTLEELYGLTDMILTDRE